MFCKTYKSGLLSNFENETKMGSSYSPASDATQLNVLNKDAQLSSVLTSKSNNTKAKASALRFKKLNHIKLKLIKSVHHYIESKKHLNMLRKYLNEKNLPAMG